MRPNPRRIDIGSSGCRGYATERRWIDRRSLTMADGKEIQTAGVRQAFYGVVTLCTTLAFLDRHVKKIGKGGTTRSASN